MDNESSTSRGSRRLFSSGAGAVVLALFLVLFLLGSRRASVTQETRDRLAAVKAGPQVRVVTAKRTSGERLVRLTGEARPYASVTLYAKVSGYLKEISVDKGDRVRAGQVLAVIESPELDHQYESALIDSQDKRRDAERQQTLVEKHLVAQQDADHAEAAADQAEENARALRTQKGYEVLRAPFPGTVTARFADPGALVQSAASSQTTALPLVTLSQTDRLRVYIYLDQKDAVQVRVGDRAEISDPSRPEVKVQASVTRISGELDQKTRTLLTELDVDNRSGRLLAGGFVSVSLRLAAKPAIEVPADALLMKGEQAYVAAIAPENRIHFRPVVVGDTDGRTVRLSSGIGDGDQVVLNPGWGISDNEQVQPVAAAEN